MDLNELWQATLAEIQFKISEANFATWFKGTRLISRNGEFAIISVPNSFVKEWLENKYKKIIIKILHSLDERIKEVKFIVGKKGLKRYLKKDSPSTGTLLQKIEAIPTGLNQRYRFDNFIVGDFNELAHAAAWAVSQSPGKIYNPLFIYGKVGIGKTHLIQAVGNKILKTFSHKKIRYIPSERFVEGVISAIKNKSISQIKNQFRKIDVLIIDDIQFLAGKEKTQEEFFHIFNDLYQYNKQIVVSSDRAPKCIPALAERLRSRFEGGMIVDIGFPEFETRVAILKNKAQEKNIDFPDEIYHLVAEKITRNIRELEGALNRLILHQKIENRPLALEKAEEILKKITTSPLRKITPKKIIKTVAEFYDLKEKELLSSSRKKEVVRPRQIAMYLLRSEIKASFPFIAKIFGGKDHTTAIYACEKIDKEIEKDFVLERDLNLIKIRLSEVY